MRGKTKITRLRVQTIGTTGKIGTSIQTRTQLVRRANLMFRNVTARNFDDITFLNGAKKNVNTFGPGLVISYDSRDFIPNPARGFFAQLEQQFFPGWLGNDDSFKRTSRGLPILPENVERCHTRQPVTRNIQLRDTPWSMVSLMGGSYAMRGITREDTGTTT